MIIKKIDFTTVAFHRRNEQRNIVILDMQLYMDYTHPEDLESIGIIYYDNCLKARLTRNLKWNSET